MADKPRVRAPKQRTTSTADDGGRNRRLALVGGAALVGLAAVAALFVLLGSGGGGVDEASVRSDLEAAGCTLQAVLADEVADHSVVDPAGASDKWNTDPPTNGPHHAVAAIFGVYDDPLEQARVVHNLEHGGVFIQYGSDVPAPTVAQLREFYDSNQTGTIMAPLPSLGDEIALGAWVVTNSEAEAGETGHGYLAKCTEFDDGAFSSFLDAFQYKGPERFDPASLRPGH
jgi:Protein of unknown function (DUF3105)